MLLAQLERHFDIRGDRARGRTERSCQRPPELLNESITASSADDPRRSCSSGPVMPDTGISRARSQTSWSIAAPSATAYTM
jgi:hypothetical protein